MMKAYEKAREIITAFKRGDIEVLGTDDPEVNSYIDHILGDMPAWPDLTDEQKEWYRNAVAERRTNGR